MAERKTYTAEELKGHRGRKVLVEAVIKDRQESSVGNVSLSFAVEETEPCGLYVSPSAIVEILPEEIGVGDLVRTLGDYEVRVKAIVDDGERIALIKFRDGTYGGRPLSDLTLVERG